MPDELPEGDAQRPLRRRPPRGQLRGLSQDALRLAEGLRGQSRHARRRGDRRGFAAARSYAEGLVDLAARCTRIRRLGRRHQCDRRLGRPLPHVERRRLRDPDADRLFARPTDLLPRLEPHRHPGRGARRRGARRRQRALPHRRRRAMRRPPRGQARLRPRLDLASLRHPHDARREPLSVGPQADDAAAPVSRRGRSISAC